MDILNYASGFIPNQAVDEDVLYENIKKYNPNFSIEYEYVKEFNYVSKYRFVRSIYDIGSILDILEEYDYTLELFNDSAYIHTKYPQILAERLEPENYRIDHDLLEIGYDNIILDSISDVIRYESNLSRGYIHRTIDNVYEYYHMPEPIYIEEQYNQYHLDYLSNLGISMYSLAEEQRFLYTIARELPIQYKYILDKRDKIDSITFNRDIIHIIILDEGNITINNTTLDVFKSLVANLYHGNTCYDYLRLIVSNKIIKTYTLHEI